MSIFSIHLLMLLEILIVSLNGYKFTKMFGEDRVAYMSKEYANSEFISELARGGKE